MAAAGTCNSTAIAVLSRSRSFASDSLQAPGYGGRWPIASSLCVDRRHLLSTETKAKTSLSSSWCGRCHVSSSSSSSSVLPDPLPLTSAIGIPASEGDCYGSRTNPAGRSPMCSASFRRRTNAAMKGEVGPISSSRGETRGGAALSPPPPQCQSKSRCACQSSSAVRAAGGDGAVFFGCSRAIGIAEKRVSAGICRVAAPSSRSEKTDAEDTQEEEAEVWEQEEREGEEGEEGEGEDERFQLPPEELPEDGLTRAVVRAERLFNVMATGVVIQALDVLYADRPYARFYVLETIARVPYFAFLSVLHLYETFGWWRRADYLKVHFAESWNELHHLLVMEELGGDERWFDRFLAQHVSVAYYFMTALMYLLSPRMAYHFQEVVERHAFATYDKFISEQGEELKTLPAPEVAVRYYTQGDLYMFDEFQTSKVPESRRPKITNLYDVFVNIRADEAEHCKTMRACQRPGSLTSPHRDTPAAAPTCHVDAARRVDERDGEGKEEKKREEEVEEKEREQMEAIAIDRNRAALNAAFLAESMLPPAECSGIIECATTSKSFSDRRRVALAREGMGKESKEGRWEEEEEEEEEEEVEKLGR
ncbi:hypothetical protein CBR_g16017 [Chara braunii]|uniref:Ubiquinol oxidase n=1 Tax=Chara braunii TaxID=69332 RepID=A0A388JT10_CHABU|nr:hypothetical protein CBR_g16017 [Chara braunii]|eukprot:GBG60897.1 hypothetical protein CBR_g16017 [Chara braunii]